MLLVQVIFHSIGIGIKRQSNGSVFTQYIPLIHEHISYFLLSFFLLLATFLALRSDQRRDNGMIAVIDRKYMRIRFLRFKLLGFRRIW